MKAGLRIGDLNSRLAATRSASSADGLRRQLESAWRELNRLVYNAYGVNEEDQLLIQALPRVPHPWQRQAWSPPDRGPDIGPCY